MGIFSFRKKNKSEKRLKELTGGFTLSFEFMDYIKSVNLTISDGVSIKDQLNDEIDSAHKKGINGTPTTMINNDAFVGIKPFDEYVEWVKKFGAEER